MGNLFSPLGVIDDSHRGQLLPLSPCWTQNSAGCVVCYGLRVGGRTDRRADGQTDGRADGRAGGRAGGRMDGRADGRADGPSVLL